MVLKYYQNQENKLGTSGFLREAAKIFLRKTADQEFV